MTRELGPHLTIACLCEHHDACRVCLDTSNPIARERRLRGVVIGGELSRPTPIALCACPCHADEMREP